MIHLLLFLFFLQGQQTKKTQTKSSPEAKKEINFEDGSLIEGLGRANLDSLASFEDRTRGRQKNHLYLKKTDFYTENSNLIQLLRIFK